jgi:hypothetical protein
LARTPTYPNAWGAGVKAFVAITNLVRYLPSFYTDGMRGETADTDT